MDPLLPTKEAHVSPVQEGLQDPQGVKAWPTQAQAMIIGQREPGKPEDSPRSHPFAAFVY